MPGSKGKVLRNLLDITAKKEIDRIETELLFETTDRLLDEFDNNRQFSTDDIWEMHRRWLGSVYEWAGKYRQVNIKCQLLCPVRDNYLVRFPPLYDQTTNKYNKMFQ